MRILGVAFEQVCIALRTGDCDDDIKHAIANKIIGLAKTGERNPDLLCERALKDIRQETARIKRHSKNWNDYFFPSRCYERAGEDPGLSFLPEYSARYSGITGRSLGWHRNAPSPHRVKLRVTAARWKARARSAEL
jgi:hypothetical protein